MRPDPQIDWRNDLLGGVTLYALLGVAIWLYWPGLHGIFMLDDTPNLEGLKKIKDPGNIDQVVYYLTSAPSSLLGRPISFASFLLNDISWPSHARSFKYTNLLLHTLTGVLVFGLTLRLARHLGRSSGVAMTVASFTTALWLLHPMNVSTVLYVVQRMTELSALFTVAGLSAYTYGRTTVSRNQVRGYIWMSLGIGLGGVLATLSKENGVLIVLYALIVEYVLLGPKGLSRPRGWRVWASAFLFLPTAMLVGWLIIRLPRFQAGYLFRDYTMGERLLTQSRVLVDYLLKILLPHQEGSGLFNDDYQISHGIVDPTTTLVCIIALGSLFILAVSVRQRAPVLAFAIFWFFAGHLLESTVIPLELYFEHRNYLPMYGPLMALAYYAVSVRGLIRRVSVPALTALVAIMAVMTWQSAREWGNPLLLAEIWVEEHPTSPRGHQFSADIWFKMGNRAKAEERVRHLTEVRPEHTSAWAQLVMLHCVNGGDFEDYDFDATMAAFKNGRVDAAVAPTFETLLKNRLRGRCPTLSYARIIELLDTVINNKSYKRSPKYRATLHYLKAQTHFIQRDWNESVASIRQAYLLNPQVDYALNEAYVLASRGLYDEALLAIDKARAADRETPLRISVREPAIANIEKRLRAALSRIETSVKQP